MAECPTCGGTFTGATFCPRDGARLADDVAAGQLLDERYQLLREVGAGSMGVVYEAEHVHIRRRVAVKVLKHQLAGNADAVKRLEREAQLTSDLGHPNIVQCRDFGYSRDGRVYLVMEWLDGETLEARLERERVDTVTAIDIVIQTSAALSEAHAHDVVHRDLKPANLFLTRDRESNLRVKVLDFGIAKLTEAQVSLTATGVVIGTPNYMSPEQATGDPVDARADLYALGVILYEMVTGSVPFLGDSALSVLHQHSTRMPVAPSETAPDRPIPPSLEAIVMRCLEKRPADRFASAGELGAALEHVRRELASATGSEPARVSTSTGPSAIADRPTDSLEDREVAPTRRRGWILASGAAVAVTLVATVVFIATRNRTAITSNDGGAPGANPSGDGAIASVTRDATAVEDVAHPIEDAAIIDDARSSSIAVPCTARLFTCTASLSPAPTAAAPFTIEIILVAHAAAQVSAMTAGALAGRLEIHDKRTHATVDVETTSIDRHGRWLRSIQLEQAIAYHVHVDILESGREIDEAKLADLSVAAAIP